MAEKYIYAVARIRALEGALFNASTIDQLIACKNYEECLQFLTDKGWGDTDTGLNAEAILECEREKAWKTVKEMISDAEVFALLSYQDLFHNLKAAVKYALLQDNHAKLFYDDTSISGEDMVKWIREKDFYAFPAYMQQAAKEAYETFVQTGDGQLCDVIVDHAALQTIHEAGKAAGEEILKQYAESTVAIADIKIAVRSSKTGKSMEFMKRAMAECDTLNVDLLAHAALAGEEAIRTYLSETDYAGGAEALDVSTSAFERWCDNRLIETIRPQKYISSTIGPVVAYLLARENEIKTVRIVLSGKLNGLDKDAIGERVREMYV